MYIIYIYIYVRFPAATKYAGEGVNPRSSSASRWGSRRVNPYIYIYMCIYIYVYIYDDDYTASLCRRDSKSETQRCPVRLSYSTLSFL